MSPHPQPFSQWEKGVEAAKRIMLRESKAVLSLALLALISIYRISVAVRDNNSGKVSSTTKFFSITNK